MPLPPGLMTFMSLINFAVHVVQSSTYNICGSFMCSEIISPYVNTCSNILKA